MGAAAAAAAAGAARERETRAPTVVSILSRDVDSLVRSSSSGVLGGKGGSIHLVTLALAIPAHTHIDDEQSSFYFSPIFFLVQERERGKAISFYRHTHTSLVREGRESRLRLWAAD
jgi:hypothetical protein